MNSAVATSLPKNKTGIFASEIQKMIVPKSKSKKSLALSEPSKLNARLKIASLSNCLTESTSYRIKHSAFKINVKNRKPLESVNVKLKEAQQQKNPISPRTHTGSSLSEDDEIEYTSRGSPVRKYDEAFTDEYIQMKNSFKPSAIRRLKQPVTPSTESIRYGSSFTRLSSYNDESRAMGGSSFTKQRGSTASFYERKQYCNDKHYLPDSRYRDSKLDNPQYSVNRFGSSKFTHHTNIDLIDTEGEHLKDESATTIFTTLNIPARSEINSIPGILNEIFVKQEIPANDFLKSLKSQSASVKSGIFQTHSDVVANSFQYPISSVQYKQMQYYKNNFDVQSQQTVEKYRAIMENLDEQEFLKFLKAYRETKIEPPPKQSLISFKSTTDSNDFKASPSLDENLVISTGNQHQDETQPHTKFMNLQTQFLSLENSYLPIKQTPNKMSNFYVSYISNKLNEKNEPNNLTAIMNNILVGNKSGKDKKNFYKDKNFLNNQTTTNESTKFKSDRRFRPTSTKLVNLSAFT